MCYIINNIFAVMRGNGKSSAKTPATVITNNIEGHITRNNHTAIAFNGTPATLRKLR